MSSCNKEGDSCLVDDNFKCLPLLGGSSPLCDIRQMTDASMPVACESCAPQSPLHHLKLHRSRQLQQQRRHPRRQPRLWLRQRRHQHPCGPKLSGEQLQDSTCFSEHHREQLLLFHQGCQGVLMVEYQYRVEDLYQQRLLTILLADGCREVLRMNMGPALLGHLGV